MLALPHVNLPRLPSPSSGIVTALSHCRPERGTPPPLPRTRECRSVGSNVDLPNPKIPFPWRKCSRRQAEKDSARLWVSAPRFLSPVSRSRAQARALQRTDLQDVLNRTSCLVRFFTRQAKSGCKKRLLTPVHWGKPLHNHIYPLSPLVSKRSRPHTQAIHPTLWGIHGWSSYTLAMGYHEPHKGRLGSVSVRVRSYFGLAQTPEHNRTLSHPHEPLH